MCYLGFCLCRRCMLICGRLSVSLHMGIVKVLHLNGLFLSNFLVSLFLKVILAQVHVLWSDARGVLWRTVGNTAVNSGTLNHPALIQLQLTIISNWTVNVFFFSSTKPIFSKMCKWKTVWKMILTKIIMISNQTLNIFWQKKEKDLIIFEYSAV